MSYYEIITEQKNYFLIGKRGLVETPAHFHSAMEIHFVEKGSMEIILDGEKRTLYEGDACFCDSFTVHALPKPQDVVSYNLVGSKETFDRVFSLFNDKLLPRFFRFENFPLLRNLAEICNNDEGNKGDRYAIFAGTVHILLGAISQNTPFVSQISERKNTLVCDVLSYAENNPQADLSLAALSDKFGYSREHLSRILHKYLLENWNAHVNRLRVRKAKALLTQNPDANVLEVAYACGFESPNTFYRAYRKEYGKPPKK